MAGSMAQGFKLTFLGDADPVVMAFGAIHREQEKTITGARRLAQETARGQRGARNELLETAKSYLGIASGAAAATTATRLLKAAHDETVRTMRELSAEARKAANEMVTLAQIQESGTKRAAVLRTAAVAAEYGITDRAMAFDIQQSLQSQLGGNFEGGLQASRQVFAGNQLGIELSAGKELETLGIGQGQAPGQATRRAFIAGLASGRSPKDLAAAASGMSFFDDKDFGFAVAAVLSGNLPVEQLAVHTRKAGEALGGVRAESIPVLARMGAGASQMDRLRELARLGIDTPEELTRAGYNEERELRALTELVPQTQRAFNVREQIIREAVPGVLERYRADIERELPEARAARVESGIEASAGNLKAGISEDADVRRARLRQQAESIREKLLGTAELDAYNRNPAGLEGGLSMLHVDDENRLTTTGKALRWLGGGPIGEAGLAARLRAEQGIPLGPGENVFDATSVDSIVKALERNTEALNRATGQNAAGGVQLKNVGAGATQVRRPVVQLGDRPGRE